MLENKPTRRAQKPAEAAKKIAPEVAEKTAPAEGNGEAPASQAEKAATLVDSIPDLVSILAENIRHNTELLERIDHRRAQTRRQTGDRPAGSNSCAPSWTTKRSARWSAAGALLSRAI